MKIKDLKLNRYLIKSPVQNDQTQGATFNAKTPAQKRGKEDSGKDFQNKGDEEPAPNVLTGTVITACIIQTTALPYRVELAGNDVTFYDDTYTSRTGEVKGDTSRLIFTHDVHSNEGFIMEKRASVYDTYDNVLSWFATPARDGRNNYMFIGRNASAVDDQRNVDLIAFNINQDTSLPPPSGPSDGQFSINGLYLIDFSQDGVAPVAYRPFGAGSSETIFAGSRQGFSSFIASGDGGLAGLGYRIPSGSSFAIDIVFYIDSTTGVVTTERDIVPLTTGAYDLGTPVLKFGTFYGSVSACPLPTVENALEILERIPEPSFVGERGHYGERKYFDDLTFPEEVLYTNAKGIVDIEHNHMLGFLLKAVIELNEKVKLLEQSNSPD